MELLNGYEYMDMLDEDHEGVVSRYLNLKLNHQQAVLPTRTQQDLSQMIGLMCLLGPLKGSTRQRCFTKGAAHTRESKWARFLDNLAFLADRKRAGKSVTAIAARASPHKSQDPRTTLYIAGNKRIPRQTLQHLSNVLSELRELSSSATHDQQVQRLENLTRTCIGFSSCKAKNYGASLVKVLESPKAKRFLEECDSKIDRSFVKDLEKLKSCQDDIIMMCSLAENLHTSGSLEMVTAKRSADKSTDLWRVIEHFIGRLCSWHKSVKVLVYLQQKEPSFLTNFVLKAVTHRNGQLYQRSWSTNFDSTSKEQYPGVESGKLRSALHDRLDPRFDNVDQAFQHYFEIALYPKKVHAELVMLQHIQSMDNFTFAYGLRYIGCSKRSCYMCDLYMRLHPGGFESRSCHGKMYADWGWPSTESSTNKDDVSVTQLMDYMRCDFRDQICSGAPADDHEYDSTTGLSISWISHSQ